MLKPIASACIWPPSMAAKKITLPVFFANNSYTIIETHAEHIYEGHIMHPTSDQAICVGTTSSL